jgi:hypothetical protein
MFPDLIVQQHENNVHHCFRIFLKLFEVFLFKDSQQVERLPVFPFAVSLDLFEMLEFDVKKPFLTVRVFKRAHVFPFLLWVLRMSGTSQDCR